MSSTTTATIRLVTPRNLLAAGACLGLLLGIVLRHPLPLFLGIACLATLARSMWQAAGLLSDLTVQRAHPPRAFEGNHVPVDLTITTAGRRAHSLLLVEDHFPPSGTSRVRHMIADPMRIGERVRLSYRGECTHRRGLYTLGPVKFEATDDLGLFRRVALVDEFTHLLVYPAAVDLTMTELLGDGTLAHVGMETTGRPGASEEFVGLRDWRAGDAPGKIHWRSSARTGRLVVKEFEEETVTDVTFFIDLGRQGLTGLGDQTSVEYAIKTVASMAKRAVARAHRVAMFAVGAEVEYVPLGGGTRHLLMVLDRLAFLKPQGESEFLAAVEKHTPTLRRGGTVVLVQGATTVDSEGVGVTIARLMQRRLLPIVVLIDDRAFVKLFREQETRHFDAMPLEDMARHLALLGARVFVVTKAKSPERALRAGLEREVLARD